MSVAPGPEDSSSSSVSLLQRIQWGEAGGWEQFCTLYGPVVYGWCRRCGLQDSDAADVMQEVFQAVFRHISGFQRDGNGGSLRGWLWTITLNQVRLHFRQLGQTPQAVGGSTAQQRLAEHPDISDQEPDSAETGSWLVHRALDLIRGDFSPGTWEAFRQVTLENRPISEVAAELGLTENAVRQAKFRVLRRLREELDGQI